MDNLIAAHKSKWAKVKKKPKAQTSTVVPDLSTSSVVISGAAKVWVMSVKMDLEHVKSIPDHADRIAPKRIFVDKYRDYLQELIATENTEQNPVIYLNMIWAADIEDYDWMMQLTEFAIKTDQQPVKPWFRSDPATLIADTIFHLADKLFKAENKVPEIFVEIFGRIINESWVVHTFTQARYRKLMGLMAIEDAQWEMALGELILADQLKDDIGVKGRIKTLQEGTENQKLALKKAKK